MGYIELTEKQQNRLLLTLEELGFAKNYDGGIDKLFEDISDDSNYFHDLFILSHSESQSTCILTRKEHLLKNVKFIAMDEKDVDYYNDANNHMWVYFK